MDRGKALEVEKGFSNRLHVCVSTFCCVVFIQACVSQGADLPSEESYKLQTDCMTLAFTATLYNKIFPRYHPCQLVKRR
jgi:hypothetical protein